MCLLVRRQYVQGRPSRVMFVRVVSSSCVATNAHLGLLKAKLAKLKREQVEAATAKSGKSGEGTLLYRAARAP